MYKFLKSTATQSYYKTVSNTPIAQSHDHLEIEHQMIKQSHKNWKDNEPKPTKLRTKKLKYLFKKAGFKKIEENEDERKKNTLAHWSSSTTIYIFS